MNSKKIAISIVIIFLSVLGVPFVNGYTFTLGVNVITPYFNETYAYEYLPYVVNNNSSIVKPHILYYAVFDGINKFAGCGLIFYFFYWQKQEYYIFTHPHDFEPYFVLFNKSNGNVLNVAYDKWHYTVGRNENPMYVSFNERVSVNNKSYNITTKSVGFYLNEDYRSFSYRDNYNINQSKFEGYMDNLTIENLTNSIVLMASKTVGFDSKIYKNPFLVFEKGIFFYKVFTFWNSLSKAIMTMSDEHFKGLDFSNKTNVWTRTFGSK